MLKQPKGHTFVIAEIGVNHNASMDIAKKLIDAAAKAGADAVKFQKRTPHMSLPPEKWDVIRDTPFGPMKSIDYRQKMEFSSSQYQELMAYSKAAGVICFASPWDVNASNTLFCLGMPLIKIASAAVTNLPLIENIARMNLPVIMSTGMSSFAMIEKAVGILENYRVPQIGLLVCTSTYPAPVESLNLNRIAEMHRCFPEHEIGYSGHEVGLWTTLCAVAMGATIVERHITLDRTMKGSDHAASVEPKGFEMLVREIRQLEKARGNSHIRIQDCELPDIERLRGQAYPLTGSTRHE